MGFPKKAKGGSKNKSKGGKEKDGNPKEPTKPQITHDFMKPQVLLRECMAKVKPFWETVPQEDRLELLSIPLSELRQRAAEVGARQRQEQAAEQAARLAAGLAPLPYTYYPTVDELLPVGIQRLRENKTWKLWKWPPADKEFLSAKDFREYLEEDLVDQKVRHLLPRDEGRPIEKAAAQALRLRMITVMKLVDALRRQLQEQQVAQQSVRQVQPREHGGPKLLQAPVRSCILEQIHIIMQAVKNEHEYLVRTFHEPVIAYICDWVPGYVRETFRIELLYEDPSKLSLSVLVNIVAWLAAKVVSLTTTPRAESQRAEQEVEEEASHVDMFLLNEEGNCLQVKPRWLQLLQERLYDEDGQPRKAKAGEDPHSIGLSLEYIFGCFMPTAELSGGSAPRCLGSLSAVKAHKDLVAALEDMHTWKERHRKAKELLKEMLQSRSEAAELSKKYDTRPTPTSPADLPYHVIVAMLRRDVLLTGAKLNAHSYDQIMGERQLKKLNTTLRQAEALSDLLKGTLDKVEGRCLAAEQELAASGVRATSKGSKAYLRDIHDELQEQEQEMAEGKQTISNLQGWAEAIEMLMSRLENNMEVLGIPNHEQHGGRDPKHSEAEQNKHDLSRLPGLQVADYAYFSEALSEFRAQFQTAVRPKLCGHDEDIRIFKRIQLQLKETEERLAEGRAVLFHLQDQSMNAACEDPGPTIGVQLALPILQERLESRAMEFGREQAQDAQSKIIKMEEDAAEREHAERERRQKLKQKARDRERTAKERAAAEREVFERESRSRQEAEAIRRTQEAAVVEREKAEVEKVKEQLATEGEERRRQKLLKEQAGCKRLHTEQLQAEQLLTQPAIQEPVSDQELPKRPSAASPNPRGQHSDSQAANSSCRACDSKDKHLGAITDTVLGHPQQSHWQSAGPAQDAFSCAEGGAQAALSADRTADCVTPEAAEQGLLLQSATLSPLPEPAQEAPAAASGLQDMLGLLLPSVLHNTGYNVPSQQLPRPRNVSRPVQTGSAAASARQSDAEQQRGELPTHSPPPKPQKPRPQPKARQVEAYTGPPSSCVPAAVPGDELRPEDECFVCLAARRCVLLAPCGHMPYCIECAEQLCGPKGAHAINKGQVCSLCREAVLATVSKTFY